MFVAKSDVKSAELSAVITRANGTIENLGVLAKYEKTSKWKRVVNFFNNFLKQVNNMAQVVVLTDVGKKVTASQVAGITSAPPKYLAVGTGIHTASAVDTSLTTEVESRVGVNSATLMTTSATDDTIQVEQTVTATGVHAITECGLFDAITGGNMYLSATFDTVTLQSGDSIKITSRVQYT